MALAQRRQLGRSLIQLLNGQSGEDRLGITIRQLLFINRGAGLSKKEPLLFFPAHPNQRPLSSEFEAEEFHLDFSPGDLIERIAALEQAVPTPIPHDHWAGAIIVPRNHSFEVGVLDRVILDQNS